MEKLGNPEEKLDRPLVEDVSDAPPRDDLVIVRGGGVNVPLVELETPEEMLEAPEETLEETPVPEGAVGLSVGDVNVPFM